MNKKRINQILEVLLFPYSNVDLCNDDPLKNMYSKYFELINDGPTDVLYKHHSHREYEYNCNKEKIVHYFRDNSLGGILSFDDIYLLLDLFFPKDTIINKCKENNLYSVINEYYFENLSRIANSLLTFRDGEIAIRTWKNDIDENQQEDIFAIGHAFDKVQIWNNLSRMISSDILVVTFCIECELDIQALYNQGSLISLADKILYEILKKGVAETHQHLNAGFTFDTLWTSLMNVFSWKKKIKDKSKRTLEIIEMKIFSAAIFRTLVVIYLRYTSKKSNFMDFLSSVGLEEVFSKLYLSEKYYEIEKEIALTDDLWHIFNCYLGGEKQRDVLLESVYKEYKDLHIISEYVFLYDFLSNKDKLEDELIEFFLKYIRIKNEIYSKGVEKSGLKGLDNFEVFFREAKNQLSFVEQTDIKYVSIEDNFRIRNLKKLEIRITPEYNQVKTSFNYDEVKNVIKKDLAISIRKILVNYRKIILKNVFAVDKANEYIRSIEENECVNSDILDEINRENIEVPTIGIIMHFLKKESVDNRLGFFCWRSIDEDLMKYSEHKLVYRQQLRNLGRAIEEIRTEIPYLAEYLVGVDAASNENNAEPWLMSPAFNGIRKRSIVKPIIRNTDSQYCKVQNIGFTYHVGEDYRHILSGLRHIDEVIEHFRYKPGDRLGHALALGVDIQRWILDNELIAISIQEYLEDLLWIWGQIARKGIEYPIQISMLEQEILELAKEIFGVRESNYTINIYNMNVSMLYEAYILKFSKDHIKYLKHYNHCEKTTKSSENLICKYDYNECNIIREEWNAPKILCTQYCPEFERKFRKVKLLNVRMEQCELFKKIQQYLIEKIERIGIYVETNPTSNIIIGDIDSLDKHPIFQLNAIDNRKNRHNIMLTINSDDPYTFQTNVENEIAYVYHALTHEGYKKEDVILWIDKIRQYGMESSFIKEVKKTSTIVYEITEIIRELDGYIKKI